MLKQALGAILLAVAAASGLAHPTERQVGSLAHLPALEGDYFALSSQEVGRDFHIYVRLPESYDSDPARRYPVIYLLDGDSAFPMLAPLQLFMTYDDGLPEVIMVGIAYGGFGEINKRGTDFRVVMPDGAPGGAARFHAMLEKELLPAIDRRYRTMPERRVLVGQSRGGSAVLQAAWLKPGLFWGYVASNPGYEVDSETLFGMDRPAPEKPREGWLILASGSRDRAELRQKALEWRDSVAARDDLPWDTRFLDIEGGTHAADLGRIYRRAMRLMFAPANALPGDGEGH